MTATLLYEADEWLSTDSMVLMGVFTNKRALSKAVRQSINDHLDDNFSEDDFDEDDLREDYEGCRKDFAEDMYVEWLNNGQTQKNVNVYTCEVELNKFEEI